MRLLLVLVAVAATGCDCDSSPVVWGDDTGVIPLGRVDVREPCSLSGEPTERNLES